MGIGRTCISIAMFVFFVCAAAETPESDEQPAKSERQGKALNISKKPCRDPSGRKGICTFRWDCINQNGSLMGTCVDRFVFGTCCHYSQGHNLPLDDLGENIIESNHLDNDVFGEDDPLFKVVPTVLAAAAATKPTKKLKVPANGTTSTVPQLVTWTVIGPTATTTRRPLYNPIKRPINFVPFPFPPGSVYPHFPQGSWPAGVAFPVDPYRPNRPLQYWPSYQNSQHQNVKKKPTAAGTFTILKDPDKNNTTPSSVQHGHLNVPSASKYTHEMTTVTVPIAHWTAPSTITGSGTLSKPGQGTLTVDRLPTIAAPENYALATAASSITLSVSGLNSAKHTTTPKAHVLHSDPQLLSPVNAARPSTSITRINKTTTIAKPSKKPVFDYRKDCGVRSLTPKGRIVGGQNVLFGRWPWQVLVKEVAWLGLYQKNKCGGVLISTKHVLTAGHCQPGFLSSLLVVLGEYDLSANYEYMKPEMRRVKRMVVHRHYNAQNFDNDIALLELDPPVIFRPHISPVCLPQKGQDFTDRMAYVTGWGKTSHGGTIPKILQEVQVPILSNSKCLEMFKKAGHVKMIKDTFVCAGYTTGGKDSCEGDSGGPLMVEGDDGRWILVGTVSHGIRCADPNLPGVYMRTSAFRQWIEKNMKS